MAGIIDDLWCEDCCKSHEGLCKKGTLHKVQDAVIPSRARLTLPPSLTLKTVKENGKVSVGVFTKRVIPVRSQFGPMDAPVMSRVESTPKQKTPETVWKKKNAMQKSMETSGYSGSSEISDMNSSNGDGMSSLVIAQMSSPVTPKHSQSSAQQSQIQSQNQVLLDPNGLPTSDVNVSALHQQLMFMNNQMMSQSSMSDPSLHTIQQSTMNQLPLQSSPIHTGTNLTHLQQTIHELTPISGTPTQQLTSISGTPAQQPNLQLQVSQDGLSSLQQYQSYGQQEDLNSPLQQGLQISSYTGSTQGQGHHVIMQQGSGDQSIGQALVTSAGNVETQGHEDTSNINLSQNDLHLDIDSDSDEEEISEQDLSFEIKVITDDGFTEILDTTDEDHCNWMIFVRPAKTVMEQNLIAYQEDGSIFYVSKKPIPSNTELRVWYSAEYAQSIGKGMLPAEDKSLLDDLDSNPALNQLKGRRKGRPRKYVKPTKTWRAKLEKSRIKESQKPEDDEENTEPPVLPKRRRGRPRTKPVTEMEIIKVEEKPKPQPIIEVIEAKPVMQLEPKPQIDIVLDMDSYMTDDHDNDTDSLFDEKPLVIQEKAKYKRRGPKTNKTPFICPHCNESFVAEASYYLHVYNHTGVKPFICDVEDCGRGFLSKFKLERHMLIHTCPRDHKCPYCDKSFNRKDHLKNHMITHDPNKKIWKCEICNKEYSYSFSYRTHMAFHAANRGETLNCGICKKTFEQKEHLLFHLKVHTGARTAKNSTEKTHQCFECHKKFFTRKDVKRHMITHTKRKDFLCQHCPQRFGRKDHLTRHLRTSHTGDSEEKLENTSRTRRLSDDSNSSPTKRRERTIIIDKVEPTMVPLQMGIAPSLQDDIQEQLIAGVVGSSQPSNIVGQQAAILQNLQYAVSQLPGPHGAAREIQIPAALYEAAAAATAQQQQQEQEQQAQAQPTQQAQVVAAAASIGNLHATPVIPTLHTTMASQYQVNDKTFVMNAQQPDQTLFRQIQVAAPNIDYRNLTQAIQGNMFITAAAAPTIQPAQSAQQLQQTAQQPSPVVIPKYDNRTQTIEISPGTLIRQPKLEGHTHMVEINPTTGLMHIQPQQEEYQLTARFVTEPNVSPSPVQPAVSTEQTNRASLVMTNTADPSRLTQSQSQAQSQAYSTLLRFLENLPTNNQTAIPIQQCLNVDIAQSQPTQLIQTATYNTPISANNIVNINQADLAKGIVTIPHPHGAATLQLTQQDVKAMVSLSQNINQSHGLVYQQAQTQQQT